MKARAPAIVTGIMIFYFLFYEMIAFSPLADSLIKKGAVVCAVVYGVGLLALLTGYLFARLCTLSVGFYGVVSSISTIWVRGLDPVPLFMLVTHLIVVVAAWSPLVVALDGKQDDRIIWQKQCRVIGTGFMFIIVVLAVMVISPFSFVIYDFIVMP